MQRVIPLARSLWLGTAIDEARCKPSMLDLSVPGRPMTLRQIREGYLTYVPNATRFANANFFARHPVTGQITAEGLMAERGTLWPSNLVFGRPALYVEHGTASIAAVENVERARSASMAVGGGPVLLRDGKPTLVDSLVRVGQMWSIQPNIRRPRNLIGIDSQGNIWHAGTEPLTLPECQQLGVHRGIRDLMNLDGGSSLTVLGASGEVIMGAAWRPHIPSGLVIREEVLPMPGENEPHGPPYEQLSEHFHEREFACRCCGKVHVSMTLIALLERLRTRLGNRSITVTYHGGCRCPVQNQASGGASDSRHLIGKGRPCDAADLQAEGKTPTQVSLAAELEGADGIHAYPAFTHVDTRGYRARWA